IIVPDTPRKKCKRLSPAPRTYLPFRWAHRGGGGVKRPPRAALLFHDELHAVARSRRAHRPDTVVARYERPIEHEGRGFQCDRLAVNLNGHSGRSGRRIDAYADGLR